LRRVRVTVLGKSPAFADVGGACSGYLVQEGATTLVMDIGNGVFGKLRAAVDYTTVDAVVVSHMHADHSLDLVPFAYALIYSPTGRARERPVRLMVPSGGRDQLRRVVGTWGGEKLIEEAFDLEEYEGGAVLDVGDVRIRTQTVPHYLPNTNALELTAAAGGGGRVTYGADHGPADELVEFARDTDLLMIEATLLEPEASGPRGHITAREAGEHGRRANAGRLVVTHVSDLIDPAWVRREAEAGFGGPVTIAAEGDVYDVR
jgi:ribonuclease BN (tRNA processing enzyme)